jgi:hypothetical protein
MRCELERERGREGIDGENIDTIDYVHGMERTHSIENVLFQPGMF